MGTKGYRVWRHKGRFLSQFDTGAYPSDLGMKHWDSVPKDPAEVEGWVQQTRLWVEEKMKSLDASTSMCLLCYCCIMTYCSWR